MRLVHAVAASIITFACVGAIHAGPIIQPVGSTSGGRQAVTNFQFLAVPFTLTSSFASVEIDASLTAHDAGVPGTAFLMNQIGPGTTIANEIATTGFTFTQEASIGPLGYIDLFSGLNLGPGNYFLVLSSSTSGHIQGLDFEAAGGYTLAPGASAGTSENAFGANLNAGFPPASTFEDSGLQAFFSLTSTPEPGTNVLIGTALAGLAILRLRARGASH